jgi:endoglucanase
MTPSLLERLCTAPGTSGWEDSAAQVIVEELKRVAPDCAIHVDKMGNVIATMGKADSDRRILLDSHLDQIGLVVTHITEDGFLKVAPVGGVDRRVLPCSNVTVYGKEMIPGVVSFLPPHLTTDDSKYPEITDISIDIGEHCREDAEQVVSLGDRVVVNGPFCKLLGTRVTSAALDDRAGCAALLLCAKELSGKDLSCCVTFAFTGREETGCEGAKTACYGVDPTEALVVDVTFGDQAGVSSEKTGKLGGGVMIGAAPSLSRRMGQTLIEICKDKGLPYQMEVMGGTTGTNGDVIGVSRGGVPTALLSIPLRYMHTPVEIIDTQDVETVAALMAQYIVGGEVIG